MCYRKIQIISMLSFMSLMISCSSSEEETFRVPNEGEICFTSVITRATSTSFEDNDAISVFAFKNGTGFTTDMYAWNRKYVYANNQFVANDANNAIISPEDGTSLAYQAIYPYQLEAGSAFQFNVKTDQSSGNNYTLSDLMTASTAATTEQVPNLKFGHRLSNIVINVSFDIAPASEVKLDFQNVTTSAAVDLKTGTFKGTGEQTSTVHSTSNGTNSFKAILPPQTIAQGISVVNILVGDKSYPFITNQKLEWKSGIQYTYQAHVNREGNVTFVAQIDPWGEEPEDPITPGSNKKIKTFHIQSVFEDAVILSVNQEFTYDAQGRLSTFTMPIHESPVTQTLMTFTYLNNVIIGTWTNNLKTETYATITFTLNGDGNIERIQGQNTDSQEYSMVLSYIDGYLSDIGNNNQNMHFTWSDDGLLLKVYVDEDHSSNFAYLTEKDEYKLPVGILFYVPDVCLDVFINDIGTDMAMISAAYLNKLGKASSGLPFGIAGSVGSVSTTKDTDNHIQRITTQYAYEGGIANLIKDFTYYE